MVLDTPYKQGHLFICHQENAYFGVLWRCSSQHRSFQGYLKGKKPKSVKCNFNSYLEVRQNMSLRFVIRFCFRKAQKKGDATGVNPALLKCMALFFFGTVLGALSVMNISLAFFLAVVWVPVVLIIRPSEKRLVLLLYLH